MIRGCKNSSSNTLAKPASLTVLFATGTEAIHAVKNSSFDFVFLDLQLPDIGGDEIFHPDEGSQSWPLDHHHDGLS